MCCFVQSTFDPHRTLYYLFLTLSNRRKWRKLHSKELHNLYSSPIIIRQIKSRRMRWAVHVTCVREKRKVYKVLLGKPEGKRPLGRPRRRWEDGIRMDLRDTGWDGVYSGYLWLRIETGDGLL
jgi:hypothetical protein